MENDISSDLSKAFETRSIVFGTDFIVRLGSCISNLKILKSYCKRLKKVPSLSVEFDNNINKKKALNLFFKNINIYSKDSIHSYIQLTVHYALLSTPLSFRMFSVRDLYFNNSTNSNLSRRDYKALLGCSAANIYTKWNCALLDGIGTEHMPNKPNIHLKDILIRTHCELWKVQPSFFTFVKSFSFFFSNAIEEFPNGKRVISLLNRHNLEICKCYSGRMPELFDEKQIFSFFKR